MDKNKKNIKAPKLSSTSTTHKKAEWEKYLNKSESKKVLAESWKHKDPTKKFNNLVRTLSNKFNKSKSLPTKNNVKPSTNHPVKSSKSSLKQTVKSPLKKI